MNKRIAQIIATGAVGAVLLAGCSAADDKAVESEVTTTVSAQDTTTESATDDSGEEAAIALADRVEASYADLAVEEVDLDYSTDGATTIALADGASTVDGSGATVDGDTITISESGTYVLSGELSAGQVVVDGDKADVVLVLDGVDITAEGVAGINVVDADWVVLALADGSTNSIADAADAVDSEDANAAIYSSADLWITGEGSLSVTGVAADGITSKDTLAIESGSVDVTATDDGLRGKDHLVVLGGDVTVDAGGDGLKADNVSDSDDASYPVGVVWITDGVLDITAGSDTIDAENQVTVEGGELTLAAGDDGMTTNGIMRVTEGTIDVTTSVEGFEAAVMHLDGGTGTIVSSDDGVNGTDGSSSTGDGAVQNNGTVQNEGGMPTEGGMPGGGDMSGERPARPGEDTTSESASSETQLAVVTAAYADSESDSADSAGATATDDAQATVEQTAGMPGDAATEGVLVEVTGGTWSLDAGGDGLDSNGDVLITGGTVVIAGPTNSGNGSIDYNGTFEIDGGTLVAAGSSGMAQAPDSGSQAVVGVSYGQTVSAGTAVAILDEAGDLVAAYTAPKDTQTLVFSSPELEAGAAYTVTFGAEVSGTATAGLVTDGSATGGETAGTVQAS